MICDRKFARHKTGGSRQEIGISYGDAIAVGAPIYPCGLHTGVPLTCNGGPNEPTSSTLSFNNLNRIEFPSPDGASPATALVFGYNTGFELGYGGQVNSIQMQCPYTVNNATPCQAAQTAYTYYYRVGLGGHARVSGPTSSPAQIIRESTPNPVEQKTVTYTDGTGRVEAWAYSFGPTESLITNPDGGQTHHWFDEPTYGPTGLIYKTQHPNSDVTLRKWEQDLPPLVTAQFLDNGNAFVVTETKELANAGGTLVKANTRNFIRDKNGELVTLRETDAWSTWVPTAPVPPSTSGFTRVTTNQYSVLTSEYNIPAAGALNATSCYWYTGAPRHDLPQSTTVTASGTVRAYREDIHDSDGNLTQTRQWDDRLGGVTAPLTSSNAVVATRTFEAHNPDYGGGNLLSETDGKGNQTSYTYGTSYPYPTTIVGAAGTSVAWTRMRSYDQWTGLLTSETDADNSVTTGYTYDLWGRRTGVNEAGLRTISTSYDDLRRTVRTTSPLDANRSLVAATTYDWLGRAIRTGSTNDAGQHPDSDNSGGGIRTEGEVRYPATANGFSYQLASNPYNTGDSPTGWTRTKLDVMGRPVEVKTYSGDQRPWPWGSNGVSTGTASTAYDAEVTTFTDAAGKVRTTYLDALGRLVKVVEAPTIENYTTSYRYDALDNLAGVCHGGTFSGTTCSSGSARTFAYSSLGWLYSATNLEKNTATTYVYDRNGNLETRVDGGVTTTMTYDARDRVTSKTYSGATPPVYYCYDGMQTTGNCTGAPSGSGYLHGRLTMVSSNGTDNRYQYDALGRVAAHTQVTDSVSYPFSYGYNLADAVTQQHYPSGRDVFTTYNGAGRPEGVTGYASSIAYAAFGGRTNLALSNGVTETTTYDSGLRMTSLEAKTADQTTLLGLNYTYYNNSNVATQQITGLGLVANQSYAYDGVNRLASASEDNTVWTRVFGYDPQGNGWVTSGTGVPIDPFTPRDASWFNSQNRLVNAGLNINYSSAGNQTAIGAYTSTYDGENRLTQITVNGTSATYAYDGDGRRVKRTLGGQTTVYVYNAIGELAAEYGGETNGGGVQYLTADALGSTRLVTNASGGAVSRLDYMPYGEEIPAGVGGRGPLWSAALWSGASGLTLKFTGKERGDAGSENSLDYFGARYYSGAQGRFTSPDTPLVYSKPENPQAWNLYSYARNNPLKFVDPTGHDDVAAAGCAEDGDCVKNLAAERGKSGELLSGAAKSFVNSFIDASNKVNNVIDLALSASGSTFQFGQTALLPMTPTEQAGGLLAAGVMLAVTAGESLLTVANSGTASTTTAITPYFPSNSGFSGTSQTTYLFPGQTIQRYGGSSYARFFAPEGTPAGALSLPPATAGQAVNLFQVAKPFPVQAGTVAPAFGQLGGGTQYVTPVNLGVLLKRGVLARK